MQIASLDKQTEWLDKKNLMPLKWWINFILMHIERKKLINNERKRNHEMRNYQPAIYHDLNSFICLAVKTFSSSYPRIIRNYLSISIINYLLILKAFISLKLLIANLRSFLKIYLFIFSLSSRSKRRRH